MINLEKKTIKNTKKYCFLLDEWLTKKYLKFSKKHNSFFIKIKNFIKPKFLFFTKPIFFIFYKIKNFFIIIYNLIFQIKKRIFFKKDKILIRKHLFFYCSKTKNSFWKFYGFLYTKVYKMFKKFYLSLRFYRQWLWPRFYVFIHIFGLKVTIILLCHFFTDIDSLLYHKLFMKPVPYKLLPMEKNVFRTEGWISIFLTKFYYCNLGLKGYFYYHRNNSWFDIFIYIMLYFYIYIHAFFKLYFNEQFYLFLENNKYKFLYKKFINLNCIYKTILHYFNLVSLFIKKNLKFIIFINFLQSKIVLFFLKKKREIDWITKYLYYAKDELIENKTEWDKIFESKFSTDHAIVKSRDYREYEIDRCKMQDERSDINIFKKVEGPDAFRHLAL